MKKFYLILLAALLAVGADAQKMRVWNSGRIEYQQFINLIDSITFVPESAPDPYDPSEELPVVYGTEGAVTLVAKFDVEPCYGSDVLFVGQYDNTSWDFATAHKFEAMGNGWYKIVLRPGTEEVFGAMILGRPVQVRTGAAGDWGNDWSHNTNDLILLQGARNDMVRYSDYGELNMAFTQADADNSAVVYIESTGWNTTPCSPYYAYEITFKLPAFCTGTYFDVEVIGDFCGWSATGTVTLTQSVTEPNVYTGTIISKKTKSFKVRGIGSWDKEIEMYDSNPESEKYGTWVPVPNVILGDDLFPVVDYSNTNVYRWNVCQ